MQTTLLTQSHFISILGKTTHLRRLFSFSYASLSSHSAYFGDLSNFLERFFRLALRLLLLALFGRSVSFFPAYFHSNPLSTNLNYSNFLRLTKQFASAGIVALRID